MFAANHPLVRFSGEENPARNSFLQIRGGLKGNVIIIKTTQMGCITILLDLSTVASLSILICATGIDVIAAERWLKVVVRIGRMTCIDSTPHVFNDVVNNITAHGRFLSPVFVDNKALKNGVSFE